MFVVSLEFCNSGVGQRMFGHLYDYVVWNSCNIGTCKCAVCYMDRVTDGCCNNLGVLSVNIKNLCDLADQFDTRLADVI